MRMFLITVVALAGFAGGAAEAQVVSGNGRIYGGDPRTWGPGNQPGRIYGGDPRTWGPGNQPQVLPAPGPGWGGGYVNGQWYAGTRAPGGWSAYRRPQRGWRMPGYWRSPDYRIANYASFGLQAPPAGYGWSRYYDDAVLVDDNGYVYDSVGGLDWRRADQPYSTGYGYPSQGYWNSPNGYGYGDSYASGGGTAYAGDGYAYAQGGSGGQAVQQSYDYDGYRGYIGETGGGYAPGASATATLEFDRGAPETTTTTTTTTTEEWVNEPVVTYAPVRDRVIYRQGPTRVVYKQAPPKVVYRTVVKKVPVYRAPAKKWRKPAPACADQCECGVVCGS